VASTSRRREERPIAFRCRIGHFADNIRWKPICGGFQDGSDLVIESGDRPGWFVYLHVANCGLSSWVVAEFVVGERGVGPRNHGRGATDRNLDAQPVAIRDVTVPVSRVVPSGSQGGRPQIGCDEHTDKHLFSLSAIG